MSKERRRGRYARRLERLTRAALESGEMQKGKAYVVPIYHDDWCGIFAGRPCDCHPVIGPIQDAAAALRQS
jgi:hypothetical protein